MNLPQVPALKLGKFVDVSKYATFGAPAASIAVSVLILIFVVWPKISSVFKLRADNAQLSSRTAAMTAKANLLASLNKSTLDSQVSIAEKVLPSDKSTFLFVRYVELAAARSGVVLNKIDVSPGLISGESSTAKDANVATNVADNDITTKIQVKLSTTSDYKSLLTFLSQMYASTRVIGIKDLAVAAGSTSTSSSALKTSMVIDAYWKALPGQLGSIESPVENLNDKELSLLSSAALREASPSSATESAIPNLPTGKIDLFTPF